MYNRAHVYELSFRSDEGRPCLVLTLTKTSYAGLTKALPMYIKRLEEHAKGYLSGAAGFDLPITNHKNEAFGYGGCGEISLDEEGVTVRFELKSKQSRQITLTLYIVLGTFVSTLPDTDTTSNHPQQAEVETLCDHTRGPYGHAVNGYVSWEMMEWLRAYGKKHVSEKNWNAPIPRSVAHAMQLTFRAIARKEMRTHAQDCDGWISRDGRFLLNCFGDACDLAIYPDQYDEESGTQGRPVRFSCHNLDAAYQQLVLLAGFAKLCEIARTEEP